MSRIKVVDTIRTCTDTSVDGVVAAILRDNQDYYSGDIEAAKSDIETLARMVEFMLKRLPDEAQVEFINTMSYRFKAEIED